MPLSRERRKRRVPQTMQVRNGILPTLFGQTTSGGATGGASPISKEDEALLNEDETPQTQVISEMKNLTVRLPCNPTSFRSETKL